MASTLQSGNAQQYVDFDEYIDYQLQKTRGNIKTTDVLTAFAYVTVFVLAYLLLFVICDHWLVPEGFSQTTRMILLTLVGTLSAGWLLWKVVWPYLRQVNQLFAAKLIEKSQPELRSTLLNLIDARAAGKPVPPEILSAMEKQAAISMANTNVDEAVDRRPLMWACYAVLGLVVLFSFYTLFTPKKVSASIWRALFPVAAVEAPTQTVIENVSPGDAEVIPGSRLEVQVDISGETPEQITLHYTTADREFVDEPIEMREDPEMPRRYRAEIIGTNGEGIQQDLHYYITAGDDRSLNYAVTVFLPPSAEIVELHYAYPQYMEREPKTRASGAIDDYEGVMVTFLAEANMPLKSATITFHDDQGTSYRAEALPMRPIDSERTRFRANWVLNIDSEKGTYPRYYTVECRNERGETDPSPTRWPIRIHPDKRPEARILNPRQSELERPANAILPLTAFAQDDFKVASIELWKQLNEEPPVKHATLFQGAEPSLSVDYDWPLGEGWSLKDGDKVSYWVKAYDNRTPEAQTINSDKQTILITPERPKAEIEQQLENDRRPEDRDKNPNEKSEKNAENPPEKKAGENAGDPEQPMPQEGQPQQEEGKTGEAGDTSQSENTEGKQGERGSQSQKEGAQGEPTANDGSEDDKALESLHKHFNRNDPPKPGEENQENPENQTDPNNSPENKSDPKNNSDTPQEKPDGSQPQTAEDSKTEPGESPEQKPGEKSPEGTDETMPNPKSKSPQPDGMNEENANDPKNKTQPDSATEKKENTEPQPGQEKQPNANETGTEKKPQPDAASDKTERPEEKPGDQNKPSADKTGTGEKKPGTDSSEKPPQGDNPDGGSDEKPGTGKPSDSKNPTDTQTKEGAGGEETMPNEGGSGEKPDKPLNGKETPSDPDKNAEKRDATGEETGKGTAEDDPNADAKPAKNNIDRKDPEKPTTTQNRQGEPENPPANREPKNNPDAKPGSEDSNATRQKDTEPSEKNPDATGKKEPNNKSAQPNQNPDQETRPKPETDPERNPAKSKDQPNAGEDDLKGKGRPEGQQAEKPQGGEAGSSKQNKEGTPGGNEKGPGDETPRPGDAETSKEPKDGRPSQERGEGSRTKETERTEPAPPGQRNRPDGNETEPMPGTERPNQDPSEPGTPGEGGPTGPQQSPDASSDRTGDAGQPGGFGESDQPGQKPVASPQDAQAAEEANLEYGRQATDLALKRLEDQIERGEVNDDWLKEMGWDKADASQFLDRMKDRMNQRDASTPEALAKQRQFNEWLKRLNKPRTNAKRRSGAEVRNLGPRDLINARKSTPPAELRDIYEAYQRGISERSK